MTTMPRRVRLLAQRLGVWTPERVQKEYEKNAKLAAEECAKALQEIIDEINNRSAGGSSGGALNGYVAKIRKANKTTIRMAKSKYNISGQFEWFIFAEAPAHHQSLGLHVFNLLDRGRPRIKRQNKPMPMWGSARKATRRSTRPSNARVKSGGRPIATAPRFSGDQVNPRRREPRNRVFNAQSSIVRVRRFGEKSTRLEFSMGPIPAMHPLNLYDAAKRRAQDRLDFAGAFRDWKVIQVGFEKADG